MWGRRRKQRYSSPSTSCHQPLCYFRFLCDRAATATSPHTLVAFLATEHCVKLEALSDEELVSRAMAKLAAAFPEQCTSTTSAGVGAASGAGGGAGASTSTSTETGTNTSTSTSTGTGESKPAATVNAHGLPQPVGWLVTRWRSDPFARGAWTCYTVGCRGPSDALELAKPVDGCLFFAGEATEPRAQVRHHCPLPAQPKQSTAATHTLLNNQNETGNSTWGIHVWAACSKGSVGSIKCSTLTSSCSCMLAKTLRQRAPSVS